MFFSSIAKSSNTNSFLPHPTLGWVSTNACVAAEELSLAKNNHSFFLLGHSEPYSVPQFASSPAHTKGTVAQSKV